MPDVLAVLKDGPLSERRIEVDEPRPTLDGMDIGPYPYRLACVEAFPSPLAPGATERVAIYVHAPDLGQPAARAA